MNDNIRCQFLIGNVRPSDNDNANANDEEDDGSSQSVSIPHR